MRRTQVAIVGAGPAGLVLAHLLARSGVDCVVVEKQSREYVERRVRAGLLEHGTVQLLAREGLGERMLREGMVHRGTEFRVFGEPHRIPYSDLYGGRSMLVYPQQELVADLIRLWLGRGGEIVFEAQDVRLHDLAAERPLVAFTAAGAAEELRCDFIAGCDGSHGVSRDSAPPGAFTFYEQHLPFAWLGVIAAVGPSTDEIIYAVSERGFAGHMIRTPAVSRFYLQVEPDEPLAAWPDERIWEELRARLATEGWSLGEGPILEKSVSELRSFVTEPMRYGRLFLCGDAAHIVPPTGAKGMNLAIYDANVLAAALASSYASGSTALLDAYSATCLRRVWRVQEFSTWMSWMLHRAPDHLPDLAFRRRLQRAQLEYVCGSRAGGASFAENYVGIEDF
jgi:p-hydroxybenzoate 3-monooxygenase